MYVLLFFVLHWYLSLFSQTFLHHRYAAHASFTMNKFWERFFYIFTFITQGSSYLSPRAYAVMHRMHHAFADTEKDPHSPKFFANVFAMMWDTKNVYNNIYHRRTQVEPRFEKNVPDWAWMDWFADRWIVRIGWVAVYVGIYIWLGAAPWMYVLIPLHAVMGPLHGAVINWFAHKIGYENFETGNTSKNIMPVDVFMLGEGYHNNHHKFASSPNFAVRWFEIDPVYLFMRGLSFLGIVKLKPSYGKRVVTEF